MAAKAKAKKKTKASGGAKKKTAAKKKMAAVRKKTAKAPTKKIARKEGTSSVEEAASATPKRRESYEKALRAFEAAFAALGRKDFAAAGEGFATLLRDHPIETELCDRARTYLRACERARAEAPAEPTDVESLYLHGVYHSNRGELDRALGFFDSGLKQEPSSDRLLYASAVVLAQAGRTGEAMKRLGKAIEIDAQNRILALNDPDFEPVRDEPEFIDLVEPEESRGT